MKNILFIKSSILGQNSQTNDLVDELSRLWAQHNPENTHVTRDLGAHPLPHLSSEHLGSAHEQPAAALQELKSADVVVIGAPMYNFCIPSTLKAWIDHVLKAGETFKYTESGPVGLMTGKKAIVVMSTGGVYSSGPYASADFVTPYLRTVLGFIGITDVTFVRAEAQAMGDAGKNSKAQALESLKALTP